MQNNAFGHITDKELLEYFYVSQDNKWLGILLQRYTLLLFGVCMKYLKNEEEAKDCVQQVFLKAITELRKYRVEYFKSWIYMVARNHCLMRLRHLGKTTVEIDEKLIEAKLDTKSTSHMEKENLLLALSESLSELNKEQKECVTLFYLEKKSYQEVADRTGFTVMQVKSHIQNGKRNMKLLVDKKINSTTQNEFE
ncbi:MAG TPA: sigma-70 family RNA polymerase sigma factor [Puia sp.]|nr:sigma-70 family RNA polymerase sigma factor [Puia sp.]